jgi:alcohol dehydrogenase
MWESKIPINEVREIRGRSIVYLGVGAIQKIDDIVKNLKKMGHDKVICVTGKAAYKKTGAWDYVSKAFQDNQVQHVLYDKITPNPTTDAVDEAAKMARDFGATAVIGIGGGSPIDAAKSTAILIANPGKSAKEVYEYTFTPEKAAPIIAINLTHGTGTEADRFAVLTITEKEYKPAIAYDCIYPLYSIDDPALMVKLPADQTRFVSVDAVNHIVEASTSKVASPFSILLGKETMRLIARYLPQALAHPEDLTARYYLLYSSMIAGVSFDNGLLHFTHALEHPLSAVKPDLAHGLGLSVLLPAIIKQIYPTTPEVLAEIFSPIIHGLKGLPSEAEKASQGVRNWLNTVGVTERLSDIGFTINDVPKLVDLAFTTPSLGLLLSMAPIPADKKVVETIYRESL